MDTKNEDLEDLLEESKKLQEEGYPTVPRTIDVVRKVTLFCKYKEADVQTLAGTDSEAETIGAIRNAKDTGTTLGKM